MDHSILNGLIYFDLSKILWLKNGYEMDESGWKMDLHSIHHKEIGRPLSLG
jgi:hypothetical protein